MTDPIQEASELLPKMHLPWSFCEEEHQILTSELLRETGEYGSILCEYHDIISDFIDDEKGRDVVATMNLLPTLIAEIERLRADAEQSEISIQARLDVIDQQAARIKVLEQAFLQNAYERNKVSHGHSWYPDDETYEDYLNRVDVDAHAEAQRSLDAILVNARPPGVDGKISIGDHIVGPDQMVPCWQITEERITAIKTLLIEVDDAPTSIHDIDLVIHAEEVLRAMLNEGGGLV